MMNCFVLISTLVGVSEGLLLTKLITLTNFNTHYSVWILKNHDFNHHHDNPQLMSNSNERFQVRQNFYIRDGKFSDLVHVANIIVDSFYNPSIFIRPYLYASELNRLQENFPYNSTFHNYLVACRKHGLDDGVVIGFADIDARPSSNEDDPPRPYLSDLAIDKHYRRLGLAKSLVQECESRILSMGRNMLFLRVERDNNAARKMYESIGYDHSPHHIFGVNDSTILLKRSLD